MVLCKSITTPLIPGTSLAEVLAAKEASQGKGSHCPIQLSPSLFLVLSEDAVLVLAVSSTVPFPMEPQPPGFSLTSGSPSPIT